MIKFASFDGIITAAEKFHTAVRERNFGCYIILTIEKNTDGTKNTVTFIVEPTTYFVDFVTVGVGDSITGFYDASAPVPLIYPPRYRALVISENLPGRSVKADYFNGDLVSRDGMLKLNISPDTKVLLRNNQTFTGNPAGRNLVVVYGFTTRSIPAQTTPEQVIVLCE